MLLLRDRPSELAPDGCVDELSWRTLRGCSGDREVGRRRRKPAADRALADQRPRRRPKDVAYVVPASRLGVLAATPMPTSTKRLRRMLARWPGLSIHARTTARGVGWKGFRCPSRGSRRSGCFARRRGASCCGCARRTAHRSVTRISARSLILRGFRLLNAGRCRLGSLFCARDRHTWVGSNTGDARSRRFGAHLRLLSTRQSPDSGDPRFSVLPTRIECRCT